MNKPHYTYDQADKDVQTLLNGETANVNGWQPIHLLTCIDSISSTKIDRLNKLLGEAIKKYDSCEINNMLADALMELSK